MKNILLVIMLISGLAAAAIEPKVAQAEIILPTIVIHKPKAAPRGAATLMAQNSVDRQEATVRVPEPPGVNPPLVRNSGETD